MNKNIIELLRDVNINMSIREIKNIIEEVRGALVDLIEEFYNDEIIFKILHMIDNTDIYNIPLIIIIDFCIQ